LDEFQNQFINGDHEFLFDTSDAGTLNFCKSMVSNCCNGENDLTPEDAKKNLLTAVLSEKYTIAYLTGLKLMARDKKIKIKLKAFIDERKSFVNRINLKIQDTDQN